MRITESQLRKVIREVIKEVEYADIRATQSQEAIHTNAAFPSGPSRSSKEQDEIDIENAKRLEQMRQQEIEQEHRYNVDGPYDSFSGNYYPGGR